MRMKFFACTAAVLGFLGVALGAFGAHGLKTKISAEMLAVYETGVRYQMYHVAALLFIVCLAQSSKIQNLSLSASFFLAGIVIFSGSLYILVFSGVKAWGAVTPVGGLCLLAGWTLLFFKLLKS